MFVTDYGHGIETVHARNRCDPAKPGQGIEQGGDIAATGRRDIAANDDLRFVIGRPWRVPARPGLPRLAWY